MASTDDVPWPSLSRKVDEVFSSVDQAKGPGCAVGVIKDGRYVHSAGYGMANLEHHIPIATNSVFRVGSLSKQFTAMAVALAAEGGDVDLGADVHSYLPELPDYGKPVTVRQLIGHVGGMGDYDDLDPYVTNAIGAPFRFDNQDYLTIDEFFGILTKVPLIYEPGKALEYSNLGYFLLSQIIKRATNQTLRQYAQEHIFDPLGMKQSFFNDNVNGVVPHRASGYKSVDGGHETFDTNLDWVGDGGIYTSVDDFLAWDQNFYEPQLGEQPRALIDLTTTPLTDKVFLGSDTKYGFGQMVGTYEDEPMISHGGAWVAFTSFYARLPRLKFSIVAFCNGDDLSADSYAESVFDIYWPAIKPDD